jgi:hypothetical protein
MRPSPRAALARVIHDRSRPRAGRRRRALVPVSLLLTLAAVVVTGSGLLDSGRVGSRSAPGARASLAAPPGHRLVPAGVSASAVAPAGRDADGEPVHYRPRNVLDQDAATAWRVEGDGIGEALSFRWDRPVQLTWIGLLPGYAKRDPGDGTDRFRDNRRVLRVRYDFGDGTSVVQRFAERDAVQWTPVRARTSSVVVVILETTRGPRRDFTAVSEVAFLG